MNIFTVNQVNQVYVLKPNSTVNAAVTKDSNLGSVEVAATADGKNIYFKHLGAGGVTRSDLIPIESIMDIKATPASAMAMKLPVAVVTLNSEATSSGKVIAGEDYILKLKFQNPIGMSPDNQYWKYGAVHATDMLPSDFYAKMALSLAKNMSRDAVQLVNIKLKTASTPVTVTASTTEASLSGTYTGIIIEAVEPAWILGIKQQKQPVFSVEPDVIDNGVDEVVWGDVVYSDSKKTTGGVAPATGIETTAANVPAATVVNNSKLMADFEYFFMGERADQYRMVNWPDYIPTKYLVDAEYAYGYDTVGIHFAYTGSNHAIQKSEKDITFIIPRASTDTTAGATGALANSLMSIIDGTIDNSNS